MSEILRKRTDETQWQYVKRITDNRKEYDMDYSEWAKAICDYDCSSDNGRKAYYIVKPLLEQLDDEIVNFVIQTQKASASLLQRKFKIGYNKAATMIDKLEENGIIGPPTGNSKPREVLVQFSESEEEEGIVW